MNGAIFEACTMRTRRTIDKSHLGKFIFAPDRIKEKRRTD